MSEKVAADPEVASGKALVALLLRTWFKALDIWKNEMTGRCGAFVYDGLRR